MFTCIERGIHVITGKPVVMSIEDADKIIEKVEKTNVKISAGNQNRFNLAVQKMRVALESGRFARPSHGSIHVRWKTDKDYYT